MGGRLPFCEVPRQLLLGIGAFSAKVALELEDRPADECVDAAMHLPDRLLEKHVAGARAEAVDQQAVHFCPNCLVSWARPEMLDKFGEVLR